MKLHKVFISHAYVKFCFILEQSPKKFETEIISELPLGGLKGMHLVLLQTFSRLLKVFATTIRIQRTQRIFNSFFFLNFINHLLIQPLAWVCVTWLRVR